ncbi:MAG TPA: xanthine dehydrogenase family protein molybdopterin-binding subunit, partial [Solirubrobacteraceae bacterium]
ERIHYAGQDVALVVAETFEQARYAASLVRVAYAEEEPAELGPEEPAAFLAASEPAGDQLQHTRGDVDGALAAAHARIEATYTTPHESHNPMEPAATIAEWRDGALTVWDATQWVRGTQRSLAGTFGLEPDQVRVICPFVGGGFGCKGPEWPHTVLAAAAARDLGRPVKLVLTRAQMFTSVGHRPPTVQRMTAGAEADGTITALRHETACAQSVVGDFVEQCGRSTTKVLYASPNAEVTHRVVKTNSGPGTFMRAPGECPGSFALECALDELAIALDMDPLALRLRNDTLTDPSTGKPFSSRHMRECFERGAEAFGWGRRDPRPGAMRDGDDLIGWGMAGAVFPGLRMPASARVAITADGRARVRAATHDLGTGAYTVFTQVAADALGLPPERVTFELGDSSFPNAPVAGGSNSTASVSEAVSAACATARTELGELAGAPGASLAELDVADVLSGAGRESVEGEASVAPDDEVASAYTMLSFGAQFVEVRIDPGFPRVRVARVVSVMDAGRILNPKTSASQVAGSVVMGIGMALMEETAVDPGTGRIVGDNLADYAMPVNPDAPAVEVQ